MFHNHEVPSSILGPATKNELSELQILISIQRVFLWLNLPDFCLIFAFFAFIFAEFWRILTNFDEDCVLKSC